MHHTPGPWAQSPLSPVDILAADETMIAMAREGLNGISRDQAIANARLIAAAPELLAALQECADALERLDARLLRLTGSPYECELGEITRARAAISKATGE